MKATPSAVPSASSPTIISYIPRVCLIVALLAGLLAATPGQAQFKKKLFPGKAYARDTVVTVTGGVTDSNGTPIQDIEVVLEGSRRNFKFKKFKKENDHPRVVSTKTNARGEYTLRWRWHEYYNHFELRTVVPVRRTGGKEAPEVLASADLSTRILNGSPVAANLEIADTTFLESMRSFIASLDSQDEDRIYREMGKPDKVETLKFPDREEVSWWYFGQGKTFRFTDGQVDQVVDFDPIGKFENSP